jgi:hypothetical protein
LTTLTDDTNFDDGAFQLPIFPGGRIHHDRCAWFGLESARQIPFRVLQEEASAFPTVDFKYVDDVEQSRPDGIASRCVRIGSDLIKRVS